MALFGFWKKKHPRNVLFVEALHLFEQSLCSCGWSSLLAHDDTAPWQFGVDDSVTCWACAKVDQYQEGEEGKRSQHGMKLRVESTLERDSGR